MLIYSIELSAEKIYHPRTREYFKEVFQSFVNGSNRSAVVMLYSVVMSDLVYKLQELENIYEDKKAIHILDEIKKKQTENPRSSEWEVYLINEVAKSTNLLDTSAQVNLENLRSQRHLSAHPVLNQENLLVKPNDETVRALIRNTLESILTKNPIMSRDVFTLLLSDMEENKDSLITDNLLKKYLDSKYLKNINNNILNVLFKDIWNITFNCKSERCEINRKINARVLTILYLENKDSNKQFFKENKSLFKINYEKEILLILTEFIGDNPAIYDLLESHEVLKLNDRISGDIQFLLRSPFLQKDMENHFKQLAKIFLNFEEDSNVLEHQLTDDELNMLNRWANKNEVLVNYHELLIRLFINSKNFKSADINYKVYIQKNLKKFNDDHFILLLNGIDSNFQCYKRNRAKLDNTEIIDYANVYFDSDFDYKIEYPNIDYFVDEYVSEIE